MEYPLNPSYTFRIDTISRPLILLLILATIQPLALIAATVVPWDFADPLWRVRAFSLFLGTAPQVAICLVLVAALGMFAQRYIAVRGAAIAALVLAVSLVPILILFWLDVLQLRRNVSMDQLRRFEITSAQTAIMAVLLVPALLWVGICGMQAGKRMPSFDVEDALMLNQEPAPGPLDPRVTN